MPMFVETLILHCVSDIESDVMTKFNTTANAIFNWTLKSCFHSEDQHQTLWFRAAYMENNLLCIIHCVSVLCVRLKTANNNVKNSLEFIISCVLHIKTQILFHLKMQTLFVRLDISNVKGKENSKTYIPAFDRHKTRKVSCLCRKTIDLMYCRSIDR